jgi:HTH-type transcriptional regulator/antitoxin HipB
MLSADDDMQVRAPIDLGLVIRARRKQLGLDQRGLAQRVGVSRQWIIAIEQGKPSAELGLVLRTLRELGIRLDAVSPEAEKPPRGHPAAAIDLDAIVDRARAKRK